ncbi:MAG: RluA family pseudouridine synthase [Rikenellaceae bacterium]|nr:RluA family pseudouridine synthase [Rikenellaceae bacterium]MCL2692556.1 RluA family pseudouridine synthase [Rikenellaceae bacterium]
MFTRDRILYEDNHLIAVGKLAGELVQPDAENTSALEDEIKDFIKKRDKKPGGVFLGVAHRIDRPVSGVVMFAKTSKALARLNEMFKNRTIEKRYWAIVEQLPEPSEGILEHYISRDGRTNRAHVYTSQKGDAKLARLAYTHLASSRNYHLLEVDLQTGRHHQIRAQLAKIGSPIRGDLKYGAARSNPDGGISLHARSLDFEHPVTRQRLVITAPAPSDDNLWRFFQEAACAGV